MSPLKTFSLAACLLLSFSTHAQMWGDRNKLYFSNKLFLKVCPNTVFDNKGGLLPVSLEYAFADIWGVQADVGIPLFTEIIGGNKNKQIRSDFRVGGGIRNYFAVNDERRGYYGFEAFYRRQEAHWNNGSYGMLIRNFSSADALMQSRVVSTFIGFSKNLAGNLYFDGQVGLGFNRTSMEWTNIENEVNTYIDNKSMWINEDEANGTRNTIFIPLRISLSWMLNTSRKRYF